jgi:hypothetical protein
VTGEWNQTPLPNGSIRLTKRGRINPLTGKAYSADGKLRKALADPRTYIDAHNAHRKAGVQ